MRPRPLALAVTFVLSVVFTALVAAGELGVIWLLTGPAIVSALEIVVSWFLDRGAGASIGADGTAPNPPIAPVASHPVASR